MFLLTHIILILLSAQTIWHHPDSLVALPAADTYQYARHEDIDGHDMADLANACEVSLCKHIDF